MEIEGTLVNRNNRAKEQVLYKVIAEREAEIERLKGVIGKLHIEIAILTSSGQGLAQELRTLKSKEYRRSVRRKKAKGEVVTA